jgi:hypothetical protein
MKLGFPLPVGACLEPCALVKSQAQYGFGADTQTAETE